MEDIVIIGSGPAGLAAAIYAARASLHPLVFEGVAPGGQLTVSHEVENLPGFPEPITGAELMDRFRSQAERFGTRFKPEEAQTLEKGAHGFTVVAPAGSVEARVIVAATGAVARRLNIPSESKFYGRGVSGCATCDAAFFRDKEVLVVGGGNTAMQDAAFLTRFARKVTIVHRREYLRAAPVEVNKMKINPKIAWLVPYVVEEITGDATVTGAVLKNRETGETVRTACDGIFVAIGHEPQSALFKEFVDLDDHGFILTEDGSTTTRTPGLFACGDVMDPVYKQAVTSAGTGCMAAPDPQRYLENSH